MTVKTGSNEVSEQIRSEVERLDGLLSTTDSESDVYKLNQYGSATVDEITGDIVKKSLDVCKDTDGAVDITVYPIVKEWGFTTEGYKVPSSSEIEKLLQNVDYSNVQVEDDMITLQSGTELDLGAVAKGYCADVGIEICRANGIESALLNFGGTVATVGKKADSTDWKIGISNPKNESDYFGYIESSDEIVATSGGYERYFVGEDGKTYIHIIDPKTGYPVDNGVESVTVVSENGLRSDALSTALFVLGLDKATEYWQKNRDFDFVIVTNENEVFLTGGVADRFTLAQGCESYKLNRI